MNPSNPRNPGSIRSQLYDRYVTTFKSENAALTASDLAHYYTWCEARYFPHLKHLSHSASILELGCGHGRILSYLREKGFTNGKGIDISQEQVDLARESGLDARRADVFEYLENHSEPLDAVLAIDFVEHFTKTELMRLFELLQTSLKPGGILLLQTPNAEGLFARQVMYGDLTHETILSPGSLGQLLRANSFNDIRFYECAPVPNGIVGAARALAWKMIRATANTIRRIESHKTQELWTENFICISKRNVD